MQCSQCGSTNDPSASFCATCGAPLGAETGAGSESPPSPASGWGSAMAPGANAPAAMGPPGTTGMPGFDPGTAPGTRFRRTEFAGWWQRLGGALLDTLILVPLLLVVLVPIGVAYAGANPDWAPYDERTGELAPLLLFPAILLQLAWEVAWLSSSRMARPGQWIAGYRVVQLDGSACSPGRAGLRAAPKLVGSLPGMAFGLIGLAITLGSAFTIGLSARRQGVHDMIAGTVCVRRSALAEHGIGPDAEERARMQAAQAQWAAQHAQYGQHGHGQYGQPQSDPPGPAQGGWTPPPPPPPPQS